MGFWGFGVWRNLLLSPARPFDHVQRLTVVDETFVALAMASDFLQVVAFSGSVGCPCLDVLAGLRR